MLRVAAARIAWQECSSSRLSSRSLSRINYDATASDVEALLHETLDRRQVKDDSPGRVLTTKREAIALYRLIFRYSRLFVWTNDVGVPWRDVIRGSARQEFESARFETDPAIINRMLVVGRDAVEQTKAKFMEKREQIIAAEETLPSAGR